VPGQAATFQEPIFTFSFCGRVYSERRACTALERDCGEEVCGSLGGGGEEVELRVLDAIFWIDFRIWG
jgi:hypothetical protein